ncbi:MAG: hypothetical protein GXY92_03870 [Syntrophomonadaceae bacterium]|nr:hypothetical protein [Syntrophomonadaceae bacterium]
MNYSHLARLTCDYGIIQFAPHGEPDINSGCTTDDTARALLVALNMEGSQREEYAHLYCEALRKAWRRGEGWRNWWLPNRGFVTDLDSEDSQGRAFMASCFGAVSDLPEVSAACREMATDALSFIEALEFPRSNAYVLIGCTVLAREMPEAEQRVSGIIQRCVEQLTRLYRLYNSPGWRWFEERMTYCNAILPHALFSYCRIKLDRKVQDTARDSLLFLGDSLLAKGYFAPVGNRGWWEKGKKIPLFDQQPVEAGSMILACREAFMVTGQKDFQTMMEMIWQWYLGKNIHDLPLINSETGGCHDGLTPDGLNPNQGAEALVTMLLAEQLLHS